MTGNVKYFLGRKKKTFIFPCILGDGSSSTGGLWKIEIHKTRELHCECNHYSRLEKSLKKWNQNYRATFS